MHMMSISKISSLPERFLARIRRLKNFDRINKIYWIDLLRMRGGQKYFPTISATAFPRILCILLILSKNRVQV